MKKLIAMILALAAVFSLTACGSKTENPGETQVQDATGGANAVVTPEEDTEPTDPLTSAKAAIEKGDHQTAYDILSAIENPTEEEKKLLSCFRWLVVSMKKDVGGIYIYTYDEKGNLQAIEDTYGRYKATSTFTLDEKGNIVEENFSNSTNPDEKYTYNYDEQGNIQTVEMTYITSGYGETYTYDENGNLVSKVKLSNNEAYSTETYTYDEKGNLLIEEHTIPSSQYYAKTTYTYDEQGRLLKKEGYNTNGGSSTVTYTCDEDGKLLTSDRIDNNGYTEKRTYSYTYDEYGNLLSESALDENTGVVYRNTYEYLVFYNPNFAEEPYTDPIGIFAPRMISSSMG